MATEKPGKTQKLKVDKEAVRMLAIEIGAREAARRLGLNEDTVCNWSSRYKWKLPKRNQFAVSLREAQQPASKLKASPSEVLLATHKELEEGTRSSMARATRRAAQEAEQLEHVLPRTQQLQQLATAASRVFGWDAPQARDTYNTLVISPEMIDAIRAAADA